MSAVTERKAVLVTGGAVRLGRAIAISLAAAGFDIALHYNRSEAQALTAAADIRDRGVRCELFQQDLCQIHRLDSMIASVASKFPGLNVLVNSASAYQAGAIRNTTPEQLDRLWEVNFKAPFFLMKEFCNGIDRGSVVNILDNKIAFNQYHYAAYLISKKALADATKMAALEFAPRIRVNAIAPGVVLPASIRSAEYLRWRHQGIPMSDAGHPDHVCDAIGYILMNEFITGQVLFVDGGEGMNSIGRNTANFHSDPDHLREMT